MRKTIFAIATAVTLIGLPVAASAQSAQANATAGGAVAGGLTGAGIGFIVGGPVGAAVGAGIGVASGATTGAVSTPPPRTVHVEPAPGTTTYVERRRIYREPASACFEDAYGRVICQ